MTVMISTTALQSPLVAADVLPCMHASPARFATFARRSVVESGSRFAGTPAPAWTRSRSVLSHRQPFSIR